MIKAIIAIGQAEWETTFISALRHPAIGMSVQRRCVDGVDVRATVHIVAADLLVLSDYTPRVDSDVVSEAMSQGIQVVALSNAPATWAAIGVDDVIPIDVLEPAKSVSALIALLRSTEDVPVPVAPSQGRLTAVVGFGGGAGRSTTNRELAWQLAALGLATVVVDADTFTPSLVQEVGLDPSTQGLLEMCRAVETRTLDVASSVIARVAPNLSLIGGVTRSSRWTDLRVPALRGVWSQLRSTFDHVLVDVGPVIENEGSLSHEVAMPRRHSAAHTALEAADMIILCARADSIGLSRLVKGYLEFNELFANKVIHVVALGVTGRSHLKEVREVVTRHLGINALTAIPYDYYIAQRVTERHGFMAQIEPHADIVTRYRDLASQIVRAQAREELAPTTKRRLRSLKNAA